MKKIRKTKMRIQERAEPINCLGVPRKNSMQDLKTQNKEEMDDLIERLVERIQEKKQDDLDTIYETVGKYRKYKQGQIVAEELLAFLESMLVKTVSDCDEIIISIVTGCGDGKENDNERS